jgi:hypothetical protein
MYVAYVSSRCCKSRSGVAYVAMTIHVCYKCMFQMFPLFQIYVTSVLSRCCICCTAIHVCCKCIFKCFSGFKRMLQVFYLDVAYIANVCYKCFICFGRMLQQMLYVASVSWVVAARGRRRRWSPRAKWSLRAYGIWIGRNSRSEAQNCIHGRGSRRVEDEAASMGGQQARSTRRSEAQSYIHGQAAGVEHKTKRSTKLYP